MRTRADVLLVIGVGGALGSLARWGVAEVLPWSGRSFPWATFVANVSGAFLLGLLMVVLLDVLPPHRYTRPFLGVGLLGGYTTFSTYMLETQELLLGDRPVVAMTYLLGSLVTGLVAVGAGIATARGLLRGTGHRRRDRTEDSPTHSHPTDRRSNR